MMEQMKIMTLSWEYPPRVVGGIARVVHDLSQELSINNVENHIITCGESGLPDYQVKDLVHVYRVHPYPIEHYDFIQWVYQLNLGMIEQAVKVMNEKGPFDLIHVHDWIAAFCGQTIKNIYRIPMVSTIHATEFGRNNGLHNDFQRYISNVEWRLTYESQRVICNSKYMENQLTGFFQLPRDKINVIPNGVRVEDFQAEKPEPEFRAQYASPNEKIVFYVGRLVQEKGVQTLIEAIPYIARVHNDIKIVIAGKGAYYEALRKLSWDLGVYNRIYFTGFIDDKTRNQLFKAADVAVFPSLYEPFGIVALEGMAAKIPVVVSDTGGLREIIDHGRDGMKFSCGSSQDLARQILYLLEHEDEAQSMAVNGYRKAKELYNWRRISEELLEVYRQVKEKLQPLQIRQAFSREEEMATYTSASH